MWAVFFYEVLFYKDDYKGGDDGADENPDNNAPRNYGYRHADYYYRPSPQKSPIPVDLFKRTNFSHFSSFFEMMFNYLL